MVEGKGKINELDQICSVGGASGTPWSPDAWAGLKTRRKTIASAISPKPKYSMPLVSGRFAMESMRFITVTPGRLRARRSYF